MRSKNRLMALPLRLCLVLALPAAARAANGPPGAPASFGVAGRSMVMTVHGVGAQIYECAADAEGKLAWSYREPIAALFSDGKTIGRHYAGPSWELADGSIVVAKAEASATGATPNDVALLKLRVTEHEGAGALAAAALVLRLDTKGGALKGACTAEGALQAEPYSADYVFLR